MATTPSVIHGNGGKLPNLPPTGLTSTNVALAGFEKCKIRHSPNSDTAHRKIILYTYLCQA